MEVDHVADVDDAEPEVGAGGQVRVDQPRDERDSEDDVSGVSTGPKMPLGLTVASSSAPPSAAMKSQAARSASALDLT